MSARSGTRRFKVLLMSVLLAIVVWSVVWFIVASIVDRQIARAELMAIEKDAIMVCADRRVTGYPFRVVMQCADGTKIGADGRKVAMRGLRVAAQVYNPSHVIAEVDAPVSLYLDHGEHVAINFDLAHASAKIELGKGALQEFIAEVLTATIAIGTASVSIADIDASVRRDPNAPADLDIGIRVREVVPAPGLEPANLSLRARVGGGAQLLAGEPEELLARVLAEGLPVTINAATLECGDMLVALSGDLQVSPDGLLDGKVDVAVAGYEAGLPYVNVMNPQTETVLSTLLTNFLANAPVTQVGDREARTISITLDKSRIKPGGWLTVATLPPLPIRPR